jgi:putative sugar O-methyltransferase
MTLRQLLRPLFPAIKATLRFKEIVELDLRRWRGLAKSVEFRGIVDNMPECLVNRSFSQLSAEQLERIRTAYQLAKKHQIDSGPAYNVSNEWIPIYERQWGPVMKALQSSGDLSDLDRIYANFMRDDCSHGLHGLPGGMEANFFSRTPRRHNARLFAADNAYRIRHWRDLHPNTSTGELAVPSVGNPYGYLYEGQFIRTGAEYFHDYALLMKKLVSGIATPRIVELGGGYGGQAYFLLRNIPTLRYVDFDLPENSALTAYFLMQAFPERDFVLFGEPNFEDQLKAPGDSIVLAPSFCMKQLPEDSVDLFFNSYSLAEMSKSTIDTYVLIANSITRGHILHINHTTVVAELGADSFPVDLQKFKLVSRKPAIWNYARAMRTDEYEFLYTAAAN